MRHKRLSDEQVIGVLKEHKTGAKVDELCRRHAMLPQGTERVEKLSCP